jgi:tetratricopeptide (TPR) repeat protein
MTRAALLFVITFILAASAGGQTAAPKWEVTNQLIHGMPWHSESQSEAELLAGVKESESTPDNRLVMALNDLAAWYRGKKRYADAEKIYRRVLTLQSRRADQEGEVAPLPLNDLGVIFTESGRFAEAEAAFKKSLARYGAPAPGELRTEDEAVTMHNYGILLEKTGRNAEAKEMEARASAILAAWKKARGL